MERKREETYCIKSTQGRAKDGGHDWRGRRESDGGAFNMIQRMATSCTSICCELDPRLDSQWHIPLIQLLLVIVISNS